MLDPNKFCAVTAQAAPDVNLRPVRMLCLAEEVGYTHELLTKIGYSLISFELIPDAREILDKLTETDDKCDD
ncbi:hypothetical protein [Microvirus mar58]|uniref:Uncharacterized protein n=1 Tax=Microvirus mar58 TaxID=2851194 RepID=A0A8F5MKU1_9VIRU|nr:hypothetical protein [Microvirus mar58]